MLIKKIISYILAIVTILNLQGCAQKEKVPLLLLNKKDLLELKEVKKYENMVISEINVIRSSKGIPPLDKKRFKDLIYYRTLEKNGVNSIALYLHGRKCYEGF
ncbi:MAG TPA: hypothetical protein EYG73_03090 [Arcobacter sp.]|nr:hypothetical protein [Arcobacter sp.]